MQRVRAPLLTERWVLVDVGAAIDLVLNNLLNTALGHSTARNVSLLLQLESFREAGDQPAIPRGLLCAEGRNIGLAISCKTYWTAEHLESVQGWVPGDS